MKFDLFAFLKCDVIFVFMIQLSVFSVSSKTKHQTKQPTSLLEGITEFH